MADTIKGAEGISAPLFISRHDLDQIVPIVSRAAAIIRVMANRPAAEAILSVMVSVSLISVDGDVMRPRRV
jgi:hypothetical protein